MAYIIKKHIYEILELVEKTKSREEKSKILRENQSWALKDVLRATYDDSIQFLLPEGEPPYTPSQEGSIPSTLLKQNVQFKYIIKGGVGEKMLPIKRERIFINILESVHPNDAKLLIKMINKQSLGKGITKKLVQEAFPGLIIK